MRSPRGRYRGKTPEAQASQLARITQSSRWPWLWPGNTTDVTTLIPVADRLRSRFGIRRVCIVADRGMISHETLAALEQPERGWQYILGARMRSQNEVKDEVLSRAGRYRVVHPKRVESDDPSPLKVKEVWVDERRYVVCLNEDEARKDAADREAIVAALREQLRNGDKSLVGNKGYRRYLSGGDSPHFQVDEAKLAEDARYDGKWVLRTNTELDSAEVALQYKRLWTVEHWFRSCKSLLQTRPIYHKCDETIRGHVFCSFLALVLRQELQARLQERGHELEWADVIQDLDRLQIVEVEQDGKRFLLRTEAQGTCGKVFQAVGVALPPTVQQVSPTTPGEDAAHSATPLG
jgi:transposase